MRRVHSVCPQYRQTDSHCVILVGKIQLKIDVCKKNKQEMKKGEIKIKKCIERGDQKRGNQMVDKKFMEI